MSIATQHKLITADEYLYMPNPRNGSKQELVKGVIVTMAQPGFQHGEVQVNSSFLLKTYARAFNAGRVVTETGVITQENPDTVRGPDVSFYSMDKIPKDQQPKGYLLIPPDLILEILSPGNRSKEIRRKIEEYFARGVRMVWVIDPEERTVMVYRSVDEARLLHESATLTAEDLLPGFSCKVAEFFAI